MAVVIFTVSAFSASLLWSGGIDHPEGGIGRLWKGDFAHPSGPLAVLRVVDWNIDRGKRFQAVAAALEHEHPDLCLLQETDLFARRSARRNVADDLSRDLSLNYVFAPEFQELAQGAPGEPSYQGQATLSRLPVKRARILRFRAQSGFWKPRRFLPHWPVFQRRLGGRIALVTELDWNGKLLVVYNAHLESRSWGHLQSLQLEEILEDARRYSEKTPVILAGDLNSAYNRGVLIAQFRDAGFHSIFDGRHPRTNMLGFSIDWILLRGPLAARGAEVIRGAGASDHFPVVVTLAPLQ